MNLAIIKYNAGNIQSVLNALERLGVKAEVTDSAEKIKSADKVIFPGVGEASSAMRSLKENDLDQLIKQLKQPVLGICVGMQLLCEHSEENNTDCLGIFDVPVKLIPATNGLKVPHMGWNKLHNQTDWLANLPTDGYAYFVHSYYVPVNAFSTASCGYGVEICAALRKDNFYALQFHPEKSAEVGQAILKHFLLL